jgi:hypothetical protein
MNDNMQIYSKVVLKFLNKATTYLKEILENEMGIRVNRTRFSYNSYTYPITIVLFEDERILGYFESSGFRIGINKSLMYSDKEENLKNILRHELAHYLCYIKYSYYDIKDHGDAFKRVCSSYNWGENVSRENSDISEEDIKFNESSKETVVMKKVRKLMELSESNNKNESELATAKANELLLKYNLSNADNNEDDQEVCLKRILHSKRRTSKHDAIFKILKTFMVEPLYSGGRDCFYIEIIGDRINVSLADYVATYLENELENQWEFAQLNNPCLKGINHKNNFMRGISKGYVEKIKETQRTTINDNSLIIISEKLRENVKMIYPKLSKVHSKITKNKDAEQIGVKMGKDLNIRKGIPKADTHKMNMPMLSLK